MSWEKAILGDVADSCLGKMLDQEKNRGTYQPYLANLNVRWGSFDLDDLPEMRFEDDEQERYGLEYGDLVICEGGEPGRCALWKNAVPNMKIQKALHRVRTHTCLDNRYLYYWFLLAGKTGELDQYFTGATIKHMPGQKLKSIVIDMPPLETQHRIADILSAYDDLIENNQKQIKLLEEAAQRLYREWFVELRFPGHETTPVVDGVPEGWKKGHAEDFFNITIGKTPPRSESKWFCKGTEGIPWVSISDMGGIGPCLIHTAEGLTQEAVDKHHVNVCPSGTVLLSFKLTVGRVAITSTPMCTNEAIAHFTIGNEKFRAYAYCYLKEFPYDTLGSTSSISKAVNSKIVKAMPFIMPDVAIINRFSQMCDSLLAKAQTLSLQNERLCEARDRLLPKLMSGEVEV